jgi:hypothetical protein
VDGVRDADDVADAQTLVEAFITALVIHTVCIGADNRPPLPVLPPPPHTIPHQPPPANPSMAVVGCFSLS